MGTWSSAGFTGSEAFHPERLSQFTKPFSADGCAGSLRVNTDDVFTFLQMQKSELVCSKGVQMQHSVGTRFPGPGVSSAARRPPAGSLGTGPLPRVAAVPLRAAAWPHLSSVRLTGRGPLTPWLCSPPSLSLVF